MISSPLRNSKADEEIDFLFAYIGRRTTIKSQQRSEVQRKSIMKTINHRRNSRKECLVPVEGKEEGIFANVHTVDISAGGLGFVSQCVIPLKEQIAVEVELGPDMEPVLMLGEVKWVQPISRTDHYRIGMQFIKTLTVGSRSRLTRYFGND